MVGSDFFFHNVRGVRLLSNSAWWMEGFAHGMTTTSMAFTEATREVCAQRLCECFDADSLVLLKQVHGDVVVDCRDIEILDEMLTEAGSCLTQNRQGDALVIPPRQPLRGRRLLFGVLTADCVPVVLRGPSGVGIIHAGWRGLARQIIRITAETLGEVREGAIFACAGGTSYEVGQEVIVEVGASAAHSPATDPTKFFLDTAQTAKVQLGHAAPGSLIVSSGICTISDAGFHSFRRDGDRAGRCLTFVCPPDLD